MGRRLLIYAAVLVALLAVGALLGLWALTACAPPPLPGDELWTWRQRLGDVATLLFRAVQPACFTADPAGAALLAVAGRTLPVLLILAALALLWEGPGRLLRRLWYRLAGGHAVLVGEWADAAPLAPPFARTAFLAPAAPALADLIRRRPFAEARLIAPTRLPADLKTVGAPRAARLAAVSSADLINLQVADAALAGGGSGQMLVRLEQPSMRALASHRLRLAGENASRHVAVISLTQLQVRLAAAAAMPGRFTREPATRIHVAIAGHGDALVALALDILRQGYGRDAELPLVTLLLTGGGESALPFDRQSIAEAAELRVIPAPLARPGALDRAIAELIADAPPLLALHCAAPPGEAESLALKLEQLLLSLGQSVPPIVATAASATPLGTTGMIRPVPAPSLAEAEQLANLMDARARAVHAQFLAAQRGARGTAFGTAPAEVEWNHLPEAYRDDNRAVADHMAYKLATRFLQLAHSGEPARFTPDDIESLAIAAHERWWAARAVSGWRYGPVRDNRALLHPDMQPYAALAEPVRQKDRDEVMSLTEMAALADAVIVRERRIALLQPLSNAAFARLRDNLAATPKTYVPVVVIALGAAGAAPQAEALLGIGVCVECVLSAGSVPAAPTLLRRAWRLHVVAEGELVDAIRRRTAETVETTGDIVAHR